MKNKLNLNDFKNILTMKQEELHYFILGQLSGKYETRDIYVFNEQYIYVKGTIPVLLCSHLDTVHAAEPTLETIFHDREKNVMWSPDGIGGDDRCGVFSVLDIVQKGYRPHLLFSWNEEIGCVGSGEFAKTAEVVFGEPLQEALASINLAVQFDRKGFSEAVYYNLANQDFENYINSFGFHTEIGSYTDICEVCPEFGFAGVNVSAGYMDEHNKYERIYVDELYSTQAKIIELLKEQVKNPEFFRYEENSYGYAGSYPYSYGYGGWYDRYDEESEARSMYENGGYNNNSYYYDDDIDKDVPEQKEPTYCEFCQQPFGLVAHTHSDDAVLNSLCTNCRTDYLDQLEMHKSETPKSRSKETKPKDDALDKSQRRIRID